MSKQFPGYTALEPVGTGGAALEATQAYRPDLVLIDIYLPKSATDWTYCAGSTSMPSS